MKYKLYLDDLRYPDTHPDWRIARNYHDAVWMVKHYGLPYHIAFDHDLADVHYEIQNWPGPRGQERGVPYEFTGHDFAKWFCQWVMDNNVDLTDFTWSVHSANPVGAENIRQYMTAFMKDRFV
jgi:hypothetical protein